MDRPAVESEAPVRGVQPYRERLLAGMADLCAAAPRAREPSAQTELAELFGKVLDGADAVTRRRFSEKIAGELWPAPTLVARLAADEIAIAGPVLRRSPVLDDDALLRVIGACAPEHRAAIASRPTISPAVAEAVVDSGDRSALAALAAKETADPPSPVVHRPDAEALLLSKLQAADQLRPGFLLRALRGGRLSLFVGALAQMSGLARTDIDRALSADRPDLLALAAVAGGLDRSVFPTLFDLVRGLNAGAPGGSGDEAFMRTLQVGGPSAAAEAFRAEVAAL